MRILAIVLLSVGGSTVLGVMLGLLIRTIPHRLNDIVMGFAAGVMLAAASLGLLAPAFSQKAGLIPAVIGTFLGALLISCLDKLVPHLHRLAGIDFENHPQQNNSSISKTLLFVTAIALHKIPEGLATGVSFGTGEVGEILTVAGSISLQNIPEAVVIVAPLFAIGMKTGRTIMVSVGIASVSILSVLTGYFLIAVFSGILSFMLATAGGAMLYVISDEMIPETHAHGYEKPATFALLGGMVLVLLLQCLLAQAGN